MIKTPALNKFIKSSLLLAFSLFAFGLSGKAADTVNNVKNGSTDLTLATSYSLGTLPTATTDVTFSANTYSPAVFTVGPTGTSLSIAALVDLSTTSILTINNSGSATDTITLTEDNATTGTGVNRADSIFVKTGDTLNIGSAGGGTLSLVLAASGNIDSAGTLNISGPFSIGTGKVATFTGAGNTSISGAIANTTGAIVVANTGTVTLSGANLYTGATTVNSGTLLLDFSAAGAPSTNIINTTTNTSALTLGGGSLKINGGSVANSQRFASTTLTASTSSSLAATSNGNPLTVTLGALTRGVGSTIDITLPTSGTVSTTSTAAASNTVLTSVAGGAAYATANGGTTWATNASGTLGALTTFSTTANSGGTAYSAGGNNVDVTNGDTASGATVNTLRFATAGDTLNLTGTNTDTTGGILVTAAGTGSVLTGGTITAGSTGNELVVFNEGASNTFNIASTIADNGGKVALTLSGGGTTTLSGANSFTGGVNLVSGSLTLANANALTATAGVANLFTFGSASTGTLTLGGNNAVVSGLSTNVALPGTPIVQNGGMANAILTIGDSQNLNSTYNGVLKDGGAGSLGITKAGTGTFILSLTQAYTGPTTVNGGLFELGNTILTNSALAVTIANSTVTVNSGALFGIATGTSASESAVWSGALSGQGGFYFNIDGPNQVFTMNQANTYTGPTDLVSRGILAAGINSATSSGNYVSGAFGANSAFLLSGGNPGNGVETLYLGGFSVELGSISTSGTLTAGSGITLDSGTAAGTLIVGGDNTNATFAAPIADGLITGELLTTTQTGGTPVAGGKVIKIGTGIQTLTGAGLYTGSTTINGGTLEFGNETSLYNNNTANWTAANIVVNSGGTLGLAVGAAGPLFTTTDVATLIGNLDVAGAGGFQSGSALGLDTTGAGGSFTLATALNNANGPVGLTKLGTGTLVLTAANGYTGPTTIAAGTLQIGNGTSGSVSSSTTVADTGALIVDESGAQTLAGLSGAGSFTQSGAGTTTLLGLNPNYTGAITISAGGLQLGNGTANGTLGAASTITGSGALTFDEATAVVQGTDFSSAAITSTGPAVVEGPGAVTFNQANTFSSLVDSGAVTVNAVGATGTAQPLGEGPITLAGTTPISGVNPTSGVITYTGSGPGTLGNNITVTTGDQGSIINNDGGFLLTLSGAISKNGSVLNLIGGQNFGAFNVTGQITGVNTGSDLNVINTTVTLSNTNSYNGPTTISGNSTASANNDALITAVAGALPTNTVVNLGSTSTETTGVQGPSGTGYNNYLDLDGNSQTIAGLASVNNNIDNNSVVNSTGNLVTPNGTTSTLTIAPATGTSYTYGGTVGGNSANNIAVVVNGATTGIEKFTGVNTYTGGTTVNSGTLQAGSAAALGAGNVTVSGGTLAGTVSAVNIAANFSLSTGTFVENTAGTGTFTLTGSSNSFAISGGTWNLDIAGAPSSNSYDMVDSSSNSNFFTISGGTLNLVGSGLTAGTYDILNGFSAVTSAGNFATIDTNNASYSATFQVVGGTGELIVTNVAAPEPTTWAMLLGGVALLVTIQRRRRALRIE